MISRDQANEYTVHEEINEIEQLVIAATKEKKYFIEVKSLTENQLLELQLCEYDIKETEMMGGKVTTISWK
jgi:hypothetical protein